MTKKDLVYRAPQKEPHPKLQGKAGAAAAWGAGKREKKQQTKEFHEGVKRKVLGKSER